MVTRSLRHTLRSPLEALDAQGRRPLMPDELGRAAVLPFCMLKDGLLVPLLHRLSRLCQLPLFELPCAVKLPLGPQPPPMLQSHS